MHHSVLITGASSGIGEASAVHLARKGFRVFAAARRIDKLKELEGLGQGRITAIALDVTDEDSIIEAIALIAKEGSTLYGLVNNAGQSVMGPMEMTSLDQWRAQFETNVFAMARLCQAVLPQMRQAGQGRIINIGSVAGRIASPFQGTYSASKHAVEALSDSLRREVAPFGVGVTLIRPGFINTPFGPHESEQLEKLAETGGPYADKLQAFKRWHAKGHPGAPGPSVVAEAVHRALTAERAPTRLTAPASASANVILRNLLPDRLSDWLIARIMGL